MPKRASNTTVVNVSMPKKVATRSAPQHSSRLTPDGAKWVKQTLDPFHDRKLEYIGLPDGNVSSSVVEHYSQTFQVSNPGSGDGWGFSVATLPFTAPSTPNEAVETAFFPCTSGTNTINMFYGDSNTTNSAGVVQLVGQQSCGTTGENHGLVTIRAFSAAKLAATGGCFYPDGVGEVTNYVPDKTQILNDRSFVRGNRRLIGLAYEICDVTPAMFKGGTGTHFRMPQNPQSVQLSGVRYDTPSGIVNKGFVPYGGLYRAYSLPPSNISQAMLYDGTIQYPAQDGAYAVAVMDAYRCKPVAPTHNYIRLDNGDRQFSDLLLTGFYDPPDCIATTTARAVGSSVTDVFSPSSYHENCFDTVGSYFTGLPASGSFTVTVRCIWEVVPHTRDQNSAIVFAKPPPLCDEVALALYCAIACKLPPAVKFADNASGDFWDNVLSLVQEVAPYLAYLGKPELGALIAGGAKIAQTYRNSRDETFAKNNVTRKMNA